MVHIAIPEPTSPQFVPDSAAYNQRSLPQYLHALISAGATPIPVPLHESPQRVARILANCHGILLPGSPADIDPPPAGQLPQGSEPPDPARAAVDELLLQDAFNLHKPILAICQGLQALNTWRNGTLIQDIPTQGIPTQIGSATGSPRTGLGPWGAVNHSPGREITEAHVIEIAPHTRLAAIHRHCHPERSGAYADSSASVLSEYVNSSHHQSIQNPGDNLLVSAISPQDGVIEAVELHSSGPNAHFVLAVQWHPERSYNQSAFSRAIFHAFVNAAQSWTPRKIEESVLQA